MSEPRQLVPARSAFAAILAKDLRVELRTLRSIPAMVLFSVPAFVLFRYGLDRTRLEGASPPACCW